MHKAFTCFSRQNYYETNRHLEKEIADRIMFGSYVGSFGCCEYEVAMEWHILRGDEPPVARLCIFRDAFLALEEHSELLKELVSYHKKDLSPELFSRILIRHGYEDLSDKKLTDKK